MPNINVNVKLDLPKVELPRSKAFDQLKKDAHKLASDLDDAAAKGLKSLRQQAEASGIDVKGAEKSARQLKGQLDDTVQKLYAHSPVKGQLDVSTDHLRLSGSVRLPDAAKHDSPHETKSGADLKDDIVFGTLTRHTLNVNGITAGAGFAGGLVYGVVAGRSPRSAAAVVTGLGTLAATAGAAAFGMQQIRGDDSAKLSNIGAAGFGYTMGMLAGMGIGRLVP